MPTIVTQPAAVIHAAYSRTLEFEVTQAFTAGDPPPTIELEVVINTVTFSITNYEPDSITALTTANFTINVAGIIQEWFRATNALPADLTGYVNMAPASLVATFSCKFYGWVANANGLLVKNLTPAVSSTFQAINSTVTDLSPYTTGDQKWLTNKPLHALANPLAGEVLGYIGGGSLRVRCYHAIGYIQAERYKALAGSGLCIIGVGIPNLLATTWDSESGVGGDILDGGTSARYTVEVTGGDPSEVRTYYPTTDCLEYQVFWLNPFGVYDAESVYLCLKNTKK